MIGLSDHEVTSNFIRQTNQKSSRLLEVSYFLEWTFPSRFPPMFVIISLDLIPCQGKTKKIHSMDGKFLREKVDEMRAFPCLPRQLHVLHLTNQLESNQ